MKFPYPRNEIKHDCPSARGSLLPDLAVVWKPAVAQASGMPIYCVQPRARRLCDGL